MPSNVSPTIAAPAAAAPSLTSGLDACALSLSRSSRTLLAGLTRSARASMVRARSSRVCSISATRASGLFLAEWFLATVPSAIVLFATVLFATVSLAAVSDTAITPRGSPIAPFGSAIAPSLSPASEPVPWPLVSQAPGKPARPATGNGGADERTAGCAAARRVTRERPRGGYPPRGQLTRAGLARAGQLDGLVNQSLAGYSLAAGAGHRFVAESRR